MKKLGVLIAFLLAAGSAGAQSDDYQTDESFSEAPADSAVSDDAAGSEPAPGAEDPAAADGSSDAEGFDSETADSEPAQAEDSAAGAEAPDAGADEAVQTDAVEPDTAQTDPAADDGSGEAPAGNSMSDLMEQTADEPAEGGSFAVEDSGSDSYGGGESEPEAPEPSRFYIGADYVWTTASFSNPGLQADFGGDEFDSNMYRIRAGMRLFEKMGLELHYGTGDTDEEDLASDEYRTDQFYGIYLVPTGVLFDLLEVGAAIGYAHTELARTNVSEGLDGASFGVNFEVPLFTGEALELRIGGGGTVYRAQNSARVYGYHAGVRVDFKI